MFCFAFDCIEEFVFFTKNGKEKTEPNIIFLNKNKDFF